MHERVWKAALAGDGVEPFLQVGNTAALHEVARAGLPAIVVCILFYVAMVGPNSANAAAGALQGFPHKAGAASALIGFLSMGLGSIAGALVGVLADGTARPMALVMAGLGIGVLATELFVRPRRRA